MFTGKTIVFERRVICVMIIGVFLPKRVNGRKYYEHMCDKCGKKFWKDSLHHSNWIGMVKKFGREPKSFCSTRCHIDANIVMHDSTGEKLFDIWRAKKREPGGKMCHEWDDYTKFRSWVLANGWRAGLIIRKINRAEGYSPSNTMIVTKKEWADKANRNLKLLTSGGKTLSVVEWSKRTGISVFTLHWRIKKGWPAAKVLESKDGRSCRHNT